MIGGCPTGGCCSGGTCGPALSRCLTQQEGFTSCAAFCASIGETCVQGGCYPGNVTFNAWPEAERCASFYNPASAFNQNVCDTTISWNTGNISNIRCCCTDTH
jgi:hypothetical protein